MQSPVDEEQAEGSAPGEQALATSADLPARRTDEKGTGPEEAEETAAHEEPVAPVQVPDRYDLRRCKLHFSITMLEDDDDPSGRRVILGVRNDEDDPISTMTRATGLEALLAPLIALQAQLEADVPRRQEAIRAKLEKTRKAEQRREKPARQSSPSSGRVEEGEHQATALPNTQTAPAPAQKSATTTRRAAKGHEDSSFEQMSLFGE
jgi:hypothetical protein